MEELQNITTSTFSFPDIVANKFVYVDKTAYLHELLKDGKNQYLLARPRRFGKSLTISTLQCIFEGRRDLFMRSKAQRTRLSFQRFTFITGVSKFSKVSIFSDLNNLEKGYADRFASDPRKLFKIGCAFDWEMRNLGSWLIA